MNVTLKDPTTLHIAFQYTPELGTLVKSLPGCLFDTGARAWTLPIDGTTLRSLEKLQSAGAVVSDEVFSRLTQSITKEFQTNLPLYPYQKEIASFMVSTGSCLNASFVGSGKTLTSLAVTESLQSRRTLIISPKSVLMQWSHSQIPKWLPNARVVAITGSQRASLYATARSIDEPYYMVIGYETARIDIEELLKTSWDVLIIDEAHKLANPQTRTYKALSRIVAKHRYLLTATPVMNKPDDMFGIINFINPGALGKYWGFLNRYIVRDYWGSAKYYRNMDELALRCQPYIIRKSLEEVGMQLPPCTQEDIPVELSVKEQKNYKLIKQELLFDIEKYIISKIENPAMLQTSVVKLGKLFELCDSMELLGDSVESSKLEVLKEHLESTLVNGQKAIIITRFERMAKILERELSKWEPLLITGQTKNREKIFDKFDSDDKHKILIGTSAIEQGINLQVANILYNYDIAWNPSRMIQRAGRIHRNGQEKPVFIHNLVCQKTVETWLQKKLQAKEELSRRLLPKSFEEIKEILS